jgi:glycosyltransferase involved in cell wall biosynthesis
MNLNLLTSLDATGYGYAGRAILHELIRAGVRVALFPIGFHVELGPDPADPVRLGLANAGAYDPGAPSVRISMARNLAEHVGKGTHVGFPFFELDRFERDEIHHQSQLDLMLVASKWAAGIVARTGITVPTAVVPLGVDRSIFHDAIRDDRSRGQAGPTVFVSTGKWERRKGHDFLLEALCNAFSPRDDIVIKLLCRNYVFTEQHNDAWARAFLNSAIGTKVRLVPPLPSQRAVAELLAGCDCGVFPSRAEAWNLGLLECMSVGLDVIATDYAGHTEYVDDVNCRLLRVDETEPADLDPQLWGRGEWAKLGASQMEQFVHHLREVHRLKQHEALARNDAGIATAEAFSWRRTAEAILRAIP